MKKTFIKKIVSGALVFFIFFSAFCTAYPQEAHAQLAVAEAGPNLVQSIINTASQLVSEVFQASDNYKEYVLDPLASGFAKQIIRSITSSIVNWINSGFEGSPSFVQNPGAFFLDIADQATGQFISANGPLASLCSPFSIDIRIALSFKYRPNVQKRYACTLGTIIANSKNAVGNASINGFTAGDFHQGGWPAFVSLTTEPQNNIYGAYLQADSDLSFRVASMQGQQKDELTQGKGFLSWRDPKCLEAARATQAINNIPNTGDFAGETTGLSEYQINRGDYGGEGPSRPGPQKPEDCPISTPGSVISGALETQLGSPLRQLELADEFGEIVNALFAQLVTQVLQGGLTGTSQKNSSGKSYLDQTVEDISGNTPQVEKIKAELIKNVDGYMKSALEYKNNRNEALDVMLKINDAFEAVKTCYASKTRLSSSEMNEANSRIDAIDAYVARYMASTTSRLLTLAREADYRVLTLEEIKVKADAAKTLNDLNEPSQLYGDLIQSRSLTNAKDIHDSKEDLTQVQKDSRKFEQDAARNLQVCRAFPAFSNN